MPTSGARDAIRMHFINLEKQKTANNGTFAKYAIGSLFLAKTG
jgi:hypothetical protein